MQYMFITFMNAVITFIQIISLMNNLVDKNGEFFSQRCAEVGWPLHKKKCLEILDFSEERSKRRRISLPLVAPPLAEAPKYLMMASVQQKSMQPPTRQV